MRAIIAIAKTTIGEAIRRRVLLVILLIGLLFLAIAPGLNVLTARQERTILISMTLGIIQLTAAVIAIVLTVYLIPNEIERRTIYTILCKPVQRWQFLIGKYLGAVGALALMMGLMTLVLVIVFAVQQQVYSIDKLAVLAKPPVMFFFQMSLLAAIAICLSTFVTPLVNFFMTGGLFLVGSFFAPFFESINSNSKTPAIAKGFAWVASTVLPDFSRYNTQNPVINPGQIIQNENIYYVSAAIYGLVYVGIMLLIGIMIFERREV